MPAPSKPVHRNYKGISVRLRLIEARAIREAAAALSTPDVKVDASQLIYTAAMAEAAKLGFLPDSYEERTQVGRPKRWRWTPERGEEESLTERMTVTVHPLFLRTIQQAAEAVDVPIHLFLVGSALHFIRMRQLRERKNPRLAAVELPEKYLEE